LADEEHRLRVTVLDKEFLGKRPGLAGIIEVRGLLGSTVANLGTRIVGGEWKEGDAIPREIDLAAELGVGRSVIRECLRILRAKGMIRSRTSDGTRVLPRSQWRLLDPDVMEWRIRAGDRQSLLSDLMRMRLVLEPGVVHFATLNATPTARQRIRAAWTAKENVFNTPDANLAERRQRFIETDVEFHRAFLAAAGSDLLDQLFAVVEAALGLLFDQQMAARGYVTTMINMEEGQNLHAAVVAAFEGGDAAAAQDAMRRLIERGIADAQGGFGRLSS
jgi:GntR family transcriptional regulator, galactonate operon transcriptional repressor